MKTEGESGRGEESMGESWAEGGDSAGGETKGFDVSEENNEQRSAVGVDLNFSKGKGDYHGAIGEDEEEEEGLASGLINMSTNTETTIWRLHLPTLERVLTAAPVSRHSVLHMNPSLTAWAETWCRISTTGRWMAPLQQSRRILN